jgi:hypothetical protein
MGDNIFFEFWPLKSPFSKVEGVKKSLSGLVRNAGGSRNPAFSRL